MHSSTMVDVGEANGSYNTVIATINQALDGLDMVVDMRG